MLKVFKNIQKSITCVLRKKDFAFFSRKPAKA
jgi:hypothetical protein